MGQVTALDPSSVIPSDLSFGYISAELKSPVKIPIPRGWLAAHDTTCPFYGHGFVISKLMKCVNITRMIFKRHRFFKCLKFSYRCELHIVLTYLSFCNRADSNHFELATFNKSVHFRNVSIKGFWVDNFFNVINPITFRHFLSPL